MNTSPRNQFDPHAQAGDMSASGEDTLRLIARLPAPDGLADRVQDGLRHAPQAGRVLPWRGSLRPWGGWMQSGWMQSNMARGAAAAAIVCVVAGGGWRIYSRVQPAPGANVVVMPQRITPGGGGFSESGAKRVPQTLEGPVLTHPPAATAEQEVVDKVPASPGPATRKAKRGKKPAARITVVPMP